MRQGRGHVQGGYVVGMEIWERGGRRGGGRPRRKTRGRAGRSGRLVRGGRRGGGRPFLESDEGAVWRTTRPTEAQYDVFDGGAVFTNTQVGGRFVPPKPCRLMLPQLHHQLHVHPQISHV